jgi:hypothetical protein
MSGVCGIWIFRTRKALRIPKPGWKVNLMSDRKTALDLIERLPEDVGFREIVRELEFVAGVEEGFREIAEGRGIDAEQVRGMVAAWASR